MTAGLGKRQAAKHPRANKQRGALRGTPGSVCPQPEPNATELPSCAPISARTAQRRRWRRWWRGEEGARPPSPEGQVLRHVLWNVLRNVLRRVVHVLVLHVSPKVRRGGGGARVRVAARRRIPFFFCPLKGCNRRVLYVLSLHVSTATATGPAAPTKGFERSNSARR